MSEFQQLVQRLDRAEAMIRQLQGAGSARVYGNAAQTALGAAQVLTMSFNTVRWDTGGFWDSGQPTRLTAPAEGVYVVGAHASLVANATGYRSIKLQRTGAAVYTPAWLDMATPGVGIGATLSIMSLLWLEEGDYVEAILQQNSGASLGVGGGDATTQYARDMWIMSVLPPPS